MTVPNYHGHCFSSDEGKTWTQPQPMPKGMRSVLPRMAGLSDGTLLLSGGRPDVYLWVNPAGDARDWQQVDLLEHHNACLPQEPIRRLFDSNSGTYGYGSTTAYTQMAVVDESTVLLVYDRTPLTFPSPPAGSTDLQETYSCWAIRVSIAK